MNGFFLFVFFVFFAGPLVKKMFGSAKPARKKNNNWGQNHAQIKKNTNGHSGVKRQTHKRIHNQDGTQVFPEDHQDRVRARDLRDQIKNKKMESVIHSRNNVGIKRAGSKGRTDWGVRANQGGVKGLLAFLIIAGILYVVFGSHLIDLINR